MQLFAISDLHLPGGDDKPMNVFGQQWDNHFARIAADWRERVGDTDTVLIPGDISWAMQLRNALPDLQAIGELPGRKVILKGNHEHWWSTLTQVRAALPQGMEAVQYSAVDIGCAVVCGTRGWTIPTRDTALPPEDEKIFRRELMRLEAALQAGVKLRGDKPLVVMTHYPPLYDMERDTAVTALLERYPVHTVVYGHLHGQAIRVGYQGEHHGIRYRLVSCDSLGFRLAEIPLDGQM